MSDKRDHCIILLIEAPVPENVTPEFSVAFGAERAARVNLDLLQNAYKLAKNFTGAFLILSFEKSHRHPDLTWLDNEDPGFLQAKGQTPENRIIDAFHLAFNTGAKKVILLNHLSPRVKPEQLSQAFDSVTEKTIALGLNQDGSVYIAGLTQNNIKILEGLSFSSPKIADELSVKAKKNNLSVFSLPEGFAVKNEETLRAWTSDRDSNPSLFRTSPTGIAGPAAQPAEPRQEGKKHARRGNKNTFLPPPLPGAEQKPL